LKVIERTGIHECSRSFIDTPIYNRDSDEKETSTHHCGPIRLDLAMVSCSGRKTTHEKLTSKVFII